MNEPFERGGTGYEELDWRLQTYAGARLSPTPDAVRRMRRTVMARAADLAAIREFEERRLAEEAEARRRSWHRGRLEWLRVPVYRRGAAAFLAASMVLGASVGVLAATPSSPLYNARIWLEQAFLPAQGDLRAEAHVDHLEQRVEDAEHAAGSDDSNGVTEALSAYTTELDQAVADAQGDPLRLARLQAALNAHLLLLEQLETGAPAGSQAAIHAAINDGRAATKEIEKTTGKPTPPPAPQPTPDTGGGGGGGGNGGQNAQGDR